MKRQLGKIAAAFLVLGLGAGAAMQAQAQTFTTLHSFDGTDGAAPTSPLVQGTDGNFYGITSFGGTTAGTVFKTTPTGTLATVHIFNFTEGFFSENATLSQSALVQATDGNFYGTAPLGGANSQGTVFKITPSGTLTRLYSFCSQTNCTDGAGPLAGVVQATNGNFYGTTYYGGAVFGTTCFQPAGCGTVFEITTTGTLTTLYSFCTLSVGCPDGLFPRGGLIQAAGGNFYGTTLLSSCGAFGCGGGTVFKITPSGTLTTLYSFGSQSGDGRDPAGALVQSTDGNLYGTTSGGGANNAGTIFKITPTGTLTTLYSFCSQSGCTDGVGPDAGLVQATDGNFYGTTVCGGSGGGISGPYCGSGGTIFKITASGALTTLYSFCSQSSCTDGANPVAGLVQGTDGNFYGTTQLGGANDLGSIFSLSVGLGSLAPKITSISPFFGIAGGAAFTLTVNGTNFLSGSTVNFNGNGRTTTFVSATQVTAVILTSDIASAGSFNVTVTNPGGGTSNADSFTVLTPQQATQTIINSVNTLFSQGFINGGQDNSLLVQLQHAITMMNAGKNSGAIGNLDSFISEVNDLLSSGVLSPSQAASLTSTAQSVIATL